VSYRKEQGRGHTAQANNDTIDDAWAIYRKGERPDRPCDEDCARRKAGSDAVACDCSRAQEEADDLVGVVDTETLADRFIAALEANEPLLVRNEELVRELGNLVGEVRSMGWTDRETDIATQLLPRVLDVLKTFSGEIQIITRNDNNGDEPEFLTFDKEKAKAKYLELIKAEGKQIPEGHQINEVVTTPAGTVEGRYADDMVVQVDGVWYGNTDAYGDTMIRWFADRLS